MRLMAICLLVAQTMILCVGAAGQPPSSDRARELLQAARQGNTEVVKQLLDDGVDINTRGRFDITAVWQAASKGHKELLEFLVNQGADVNVPDSIWHVTPIMLANDPHIVSLLVQHGAEGLEGKLNQAALVGDVAMVQAIVGARALEPNSLAQAKAHAEIGEHAQIVELLEQAAKEPLPELTSVRENTLATYSGRYMSDRLYELDVIARDGRLFMQELGSREFPLVVIDQTTFAIGATRFRFDVQNGKVVELNREDVYSSRRYLPSSQVLGALDRGGAQPAVEKTDDPSVLARDRWPSFRGIEARGLAIQQNLPDDWDVQEGRNVRWRTAIPGLGNSSPIVWDDRIFVTTAVSDAGTDDLRIGLYGDVDAVNDQSKHSWRLLCLDKQSGQVLWERIAHEGVPPVKRHLKSSQANSTPATDGQHVVALFSSGGLYCYDFGGTLLWSNELGVLDSGAFVDPEIQWGFGSSPIIYRHMVLVQCDIQQGSFIAAYDIETGSEIWKQWRDEIPSWGTPTVYESPHGPLLLTSATNFARAYDVLSGRQRWQLGGNAAVTVPTPLVAYDLVFVTSGYRPIQPIFAVRLDAQGDISLEPGQETNSGVAWSTQRGGPYLPTPIVYGGYLYTCGNNGILTCYEATSGRQVYRQRVSGGAASSFTASPVAADGRIYLTAESGDVLAVKAGPTFEVAAENSLGEYCLATPAIAGGLFLARTHHHLVAIGAEQGPSEPK